MYWPLAHIHHLLRWAEGGHLQAQQVQQLETLAPLRPGRADWLAAGERLCLWGGALLLALALMFFFAYNWDGLHRFAKLALAGAALVASVALTLLSRLASTAAQSALFAAAVCTGALLALIGQTYQTGANAWELFAAWTALMLPFAVLARAWPLWLLCLAISNLCVGGMLSRNGVVWQWGLHDESLRLVLPPLMLNALWWLAAAGLGRWMLIRPSRYLERTAAFLTLGILALAAFEGISGIFTSEQPRYAIYILLLALTAAGAAWWYRQKHLDLPMLGIIGSWTAVAGSGVLFKLAGRGRDASQMILLALYVMAASGALVFWLRKFALEQTMTEATTTMTPVSTQAALGVRLQQQQIVDAATCETLSRAAPGAAWLTALQAGAAWLAALLITSAFPALGIRELSQTWPFALVLIASSLWLFRYHRGAVFSRHLALALSLSGQALIAFAWSETFDHQRPLISLPLALALTIPHSSLAHRVLCLLFAVICFYPTDFFDGEGIVALAFAVAAIMLWRSRRTWAASPKAGHMLALAHATSLIALTLLVKFHFTLSIDASDYFEIWTTHAYRLYCLGSMLLFLGTSIWLARGAPHSQRLWLLAAASMLSLAAWAAPALVLCLALMLAAFHACQRSWWVLALIAACGFLWLFYYSLEQTLLVKSIILAATGSALLGFGWRLAHWQKEISA